MFRYRRRATSWRRRCGIAALELAVCLPVIVVLVFAAMESCTMIFVTQALHAAAYEGARVAVNHRSTTAQAVQRAQQMLDGHAIVEGSIRCEPSDVATVNPGELVTVVVTASCDANRICPSFFFSGRNIEVRTVMAKE